MVTEAQKRATTKFEAKAYDKICLRTPKGERDKIAAQAQKNGESVNAYLLRLVNEDIEKNEDGD